MESGTQPQVGSGTPTPGTTPEPAVDLTGKTLGDYQILRRLGQGGMGQVYLAEQISLKRKVALKILRADLAANAKSLERFKQEALAVAQATHANIVQVYQIDEKDGHHFMALEYVEGRNLREYVEKKGPPEVLLALSVMRQVAAALQRASELGIVHRDIKPENILVTRKGEVKVADFGLSRVLSETQVPASLTQSGVTMGTPLYMSPEQVEGKKTIDFRTDIYSFGVTCYHLLAGQPPFRGESALEVAYQHVHKEPEVLSDLRPDLPPDLCALVHRMMAKNPDARPQTGREIVQEVARLRDLVVGVTGALGTGTTSGLHLAGAAIGFGPVPTQHSDAISTQRMPRLRRSRRLVWLAAATVLLAAAAGLFAGWWRNQPDPTPEVTSAPPSPATTPAVLRENELKKKFDDNATIPTAIHLGAFYLKERSLAKAQDFFKDLEQNGKDATFRALGYFGQAAVLSHQDQFKASNLLLMTVLLGKKEGAETSKTVAALEVRKKLEAKSLKVLLENPELPAMIEDAFVVADVDEPKRSCFRFMKQQLGGAKKQAGDKKPVDKKAVDKKAVDKDKAKLLQGEELNVRKVMERHPALKPLLENPVWREVLADAIHQNRANSPPGMMNLYPHLLQELHKPWNPS